MTWQGTPCQWPADGCRWHRRVRAASDEAAPKGKAFRPEEQPWHDSHDLRDLGWWVIERTVEDSLPAPRASVISNVMRTLAGLGPEAPALEESLREVELRGLLMHGLPPRTEEEWRLAEALFDADALAEFRRWARSDEGDEDDRPQPLLGRQRRGDEVDVSLVVEDRDRR
jgi:hypothetical protein